MDDDSRAVRRRSSATSAAVGSGASWRKLRRPRDVRQFRDEYGDMLPSGDTQPSLDDTINTTLEQLRVIQDEDCCVIRCFNTTANGLVNRGDSFKRKNESLLHSSSSDGLVGQDAIRTTPRSRSQSSSHSHASCIQQLTVTDAEAADDTDQSVMPVVQSSSYTVLVLGQQGVGRTALLQQFMTSQFMAAETTLGILISSLQLQ